jgi:antirestriction protein
MQLSTFIGIARKNTKGIMFRNNTQAETVNYYLRDGLINDNLLYFTDSTAIAQAILLSDIQQDDYCFVNQSCKLPMVARDVDFDKPCIYVACLASYNNGRLHGMWIDATQDTDDIQSDIKYMLSYSHQEDAEEHAIHDYQGFLGLSISEYESIKKISELAQIIEEHGAAYVAYANNVGIEYATVEGFEEAYHGEHESELDFATELFDECMEIPYHLANYIDYEKYSNDLFMDGYYSVSVNGNGGRCVYVFSDC